MKRALGFDADDDNDIEIEGIDATVRPLNSRRNELTPSAPTPSSGSMADDPAEAADPSAAAADLRPDPSVIFEKVVEVFNESLPGFLQKSIDPVRQRQALYDAMDVSIKEYYEHLDRNTERRMQARFENDRRRLQAQIDDLKVKARKEEEGNSNAKNLQLSAERQKRALSERVHDLEKQLATLEAENEQYILENKSMANKLRMATLVGDAPDASLAVEMQKLQEQNDRLQKLHDEANRQIEALEKQIRIQSESENDDMELLVEVKQENTDLKRSNEQLKADNDRLRESLEQAKVKDELGVAMVNDLNAKARQAKIEASEAKSEAEKARADASEMEQKLAEANEQLVAANIRLTKAQDDLKVVKEIQQEVLKLEEKQRVTDAQIRAQKDELMEKDELIKQFRSEILSKNTSMRLQEETIRRLEDQTESLRKNVETTLYEKSQVESALRSEIDRLKSIKGNVADLTIDTAAAIVSVVAEPSPEDLSMDMPEFLIPKQESIDTPKPRRGRPPKQKSNEREEPEADDISKPSKSDIDSDMDLLDTTDWLVASPNDDTKPKSRRRQKTATLDDTFGYKEPERQEPPDSPAQMLLW